MTEDAPQKRNKEEKKNYTDKINKRGIINNLTGELAFLPPATFKDGRTSFTIQKKLEHFPFTVKRYLSFKHQCTIYSPIFLGQKYIPWIILPDSTGQGVKWPRRLRRWPAADTKTDRFLKQNRHLRQLPAQLQRPRPANVNITFICTFSNNFFYIQIGSKIVLRGLQLHQDLQNIHKQLSRSSCDI